MYHDYDEQDTYGDHGEDNEEHGEQNEELEKDITGHAHDAESALLNMIEDYNVEKLQDPDIWGVVEGFMNRIVKLLSYLEDVHEENRPEHHHHDQNQDDDQDQDEDQHENHNGHQHGSSGLEDLQDQMAENDENAEYEHDHDQYGGQNHHQEDDDGQWDHHGHGQNGGHDYNGNECYDHDNKY